MKNTRNTARLLSFVMVLAVLLTAGIVLGINASAADEVPAGTQVTTTAGFKAAVEAGGTVVLMNDIYLGAEDGGIWTWTGGVPTPVTLNLPQTVTIKSVQKADGSYCTIYRGYEFDADETLTMSAATPMFTVTGKGKTITLQNVILDGQKKTDSNDRGIIDAKTDGGAFAAGFTSGSVSKLVIEDGAVVRNFVAGRGGMIAVASKLTLIVNGGEITGNECVAGGFQNAGGAIFASYGTVYINGGSLTNNYSASTGSVAPNNAARGGAVFAVGSTVWIAGGEIKDNGCQGTYGGAISVRNSKFYMLGGTISGNTANGIASQIDVNVSGTGKTSYAVFVGGTIQDDRKGTLIHLVQETDPKAYIGAIPESLGVTIPDAVVQPAEAQPLVMMNTGTEGTSFVYPSGADANVQIIAKPAAGSLVELKGVPTISATVEDAYALADTFYNKTLGALICTEGVGSFSGTLSKVEETVYTTLEAAVAAAGEGGTITLMNAVLISQTLPVGTYVIDGGANAFYRTVKDASMLTLPEGADVTFTNITLDGNGVADTTANGGAFKLESGSSLTLMGEGKEAPVIRGFAAKQGGAIYSAGALTIENAIIQQNTASGNGGAIYLSGGSFTMNGGLIGGSTTDGNVGKCGGGIAIAMSGAVTISGGEVSYNSTTATNTADYLGGGIYTTASADNVIISGGTVSNNTANRGAGVYALGNLHVTGTASISNNTAVSHGGGIWSKDNIVTVDGNAKINGNVIGNAYGAAVAIESGAKLILGGNAELVGNTVNRTSSSGNMQGVVIYASSSHVVLKDNASIRDNVGLGTCPLFGAIYLYSSSSFIMTGGSISDTVGGTSNYDKGGAVYSAGTSNVWLLGGVIEGNHSSRYGGAVFSESTGSLYLIGTAIRNNTIGGTSTTKIDGAAIYTTTNTYAMGGSITGNYISKKGSSYVAALSAPNANNLFITSSVTPASIPDEVVAFAATEAGAKIFSIDDNGVIISKTPLVIEDNGTTTADLVNISGAAITGNLVAGSRVVFEDVAIPLAENYTPDTATLNAIQLRGADALYNAKVEGATLVWPPDAYQVIRSAALTDMVDFRLTVAFRSAAARQSISATMGDKTFTADETGNVVIPLAPKQISDIVSLKLDGIEVKTYKLADYLTDLTKPEYAYLGFADLAQALINYGSAAQVYLKYNTENLANSDYQSALSGVSVATDENNAFNIVGTSASAFYSADVDIASKVSVAVILKAEFAKKKTDVQVQLGENGKDFEIRDINGTTDYVAIAIYDISAAELAKPIVVTLSDDTTLTYSIPAYASRMLDKANDGAKINDDLKVLVKALYAYAKAAEPFAQKTAE